MQRKAKLPVLNNLIYLIVLVLVLFWVLFPFYWALVNSIRADKKRWVDFMMRFELGLEEPDPKRAGRSAFTIATSYVAGGLVPLAPYFFIHSVRSALIGSVIVTLLALLVFGYIKGSFTTAKPFRSAWQTVVVGGLAAAAAFGIAKAIG